VAFAIAWWFIGTRERQWLLAVEAILNQSHIRELLLGLQWWERHLVVRKMIIECLVVE
jgi:hypothetical protein